MNPKVGKSLFKILTGFVVGSAIGSILGLTLAPQKGAETRKFIRDRSMELYLRGKDAVKQTKPCLLRRVLSRLFRKD